jgi:hypothetical protein
MDGIMRGVYPFSEEDAAQVGSKEMWMVVSKCWSPLPENRPNMMELKIGLNQSSHWGGASPFPRSKGSAKETERPIPVATALSCLEVTTFSRGKRFTVAAVSRLYGHGQNRSLTYKLSMNVNIAEFLYPLAAVVIVVMVASLIFLYSVRQR